MASNKSTIITGGNAALGAVFLADDGTKRATIIDGLAVNQVAAGAIWASTETPDTFAAAGYAGLPGERADLAVTEAPDTFAAVGYPAAVGFLHATEAPDIFSSFISLPIRLTLSVTEAKDRFSAAGIGLGEDGVFITTEAPDVFAATARVPITGVWNSTETPDLFSATTSGVTIAKRRRVFFVT